MNQYFELPATRRRLIASMLWVSLAGCADQSGEPAAPVGQALTTGTRVERSGETAQPENVKFAGGAVSRQPGAPDLAGLPASTQKLLLSEAAKAHKAHAVSPADVGPESKLERPLQVISKADRDALIAELKHRGLQPNSLRGDAGQVGSPASQAAR